MFPKLTAQYAHVIINTGLVAGDRLAVQIAKSPEALVVYATSVQAGVVFLPLHTAYTPAEVKYFIEDSGAKLLLCDGTVEAGLAPVVTAVSSCLVSLNPDGNGSFATLAAT